ncbi:unnamed protein product [Spirodela intermedia]|uniref:Uncharacterized protein n=1 Tax=Spirodela intermedia TaxID=51605 RepID=A0A7I8JBN5_SPIIN|nr:unnamed protein product [Spirodela intermedia]CAA6667381.1 unnamed protein product [Spirodela intermedia]
MSSRPRRRSTRSGAPRFLTPPSHRSSDLGSSNGWTHSWRSLNPCRLEKESREDEVMEVAAGGRKSFDPCSS